MAKRASDTLDGDKSGETFDHGDLDILIPGGATLGIITSGGCSISIRSMPCMSKCDPQTAAVNTAYRVVSR